MSEEKLGHQLYDSFALPFPRLAVRSRRAFTRMGKSKIAPGWLDAPTHQGYWWYVPHNGGDAEIVEICRSRDRGPIARFVGTNDELTLSTMKGRWYGPLLPPA